MKKILLLVLLLLIHYGCEKKYDSVVEAKLAVYQVDSLSNFNTFTYSLLDSSVNVSIKFTSSTSIKNVWVEIISPENENIYSGKINLFDNGIQANGDDVKGDSRYSNFIAMKKEFVNGSYTINYFVEDKTGTTKKAASQTFLYNNGSSNVAPLITAVLVPDTLTVKDVSLAFSIFVSTADSNGIKDIYEVYFITYKPDLTSNGTKTYLYDDGNASANGDVYAGDGIFSRFLSISPTNQKGIYRFEFQAKDRGGLVSPIVQKYIVVK